MSKIRETKRKKGREECVKKKILKTSYVASLPSQSLFPFSYYFFTLFFVSIVLFI